MGQLRNLIEELRKDYLRVRGRIGAGGPQISRLMVRRILNKYDLTRPGQYVPWAIGTEGARRPYPKGHELKLRKGNPGKFEVVFINRHTKQTQLLTREKGIPYDVALQYYNYITFFDNEKYNEHGQYELREKEKFQLPEEPHFGI